MTYKYKLLHGDMLQKTKELKENSIDSIVTDPPYELKFMNKSWDNAGISFSPNTWKQCLRVLKPGGYMLVFGGSRTYHRIACAVEDAGFEIKDCIMWLFADKMPHGMNIGLAVDKALGIESKTVEISNKGKGTNSQSNIYHSNTKGENSMKKIFERKQAMNEWDDWHTCLKPAYEPILVAMKPLDGKYADNVLKWRTGGMNIGECRVMPNDDGSDEYFARKGNNEQKKTDGVVYHTDRIMHSRAYPNKKGRFPTNVIHDRLKEKWSRYFYCAKASTKDREEGLENFAEQEMKVTSQYNMPREDNTYRKVPVRHNTHPTVKPTALMQYLVRLVTPKGGTVLDPFMGSGSTGKAIMYENIERDADYRFIGIDKEREYIDIAKARIDFVSRKKGDIQK